MYVCVHVVVHMCAPSAPVCVCVRICASRSLCVLRECTCAYASVRVRVLVCGYGGVCRGVCGCGDVRLGVWARGCVNECVGACACVCMSVFALAYMRHAYVRACACVRVLGVCGVRACMCVSSRVLRAHTVRTRLFVCICVCLCAFACAFVPVCMYTMSI